MIASNAFLAKCQKLNRLGLACDFDQGLRVARGFADLGFEEFLMLSGSKMVSLYTGQISELDNNHKDFFFRVPDVDIMVNLIDLKGIDLKEVTFFERREWQAQLVDHKSKSSFSVSAGRLDDLFIDCLIKIYEGF